MCLSVFIAVLLSVRIIVSVRERERKRLRAIVCVEGRERETM